MTKETLLDVKLTLAEAKSMARLIAAGIAQIEADPTPVSNEVTLRRSIDAAGRGTVKIKAALAAADSPLS
jgi:hypothetical protein